MSANKNMPKDGQVMGAILKDMGVVEHEPRVLNQMLEFCYRYVTDILDDAKIYSSHANKKATDADDVKLAIQCKMDHSFTAPPPRELLLDIARTKNSQALPLVKPYVGVRLPPDRYCLFAPNYRLKSVKKQSRLQLLQTNQRISLGPMQSALGKIPGSSASPTITMVSKGITMPTVNLMSKSAMPASSMVPKPMIRFATSVTSSASSLQPIMQVSSAVPKIITSIAGASLASNPLKRKFSEND